MGRFFWVQWVSNDAALVPYGTNAVVVFVSDDGSAFDGS